MFHRVNRFLLAAGAAVAVIMTMTGPVGVRASAAAASTLTLTGPVTLNYSATTSDNDTCTGECSEWGYMEPFNFTSYKESASSTLSASITLNGTAVQGQTGGLSGSGPLDESGFAFQSSGSYAANCSPVTVTGEGTTPGTANGGLSVITSAGGTPDLSLTFGGGSETETVLVTGEDNCDGSGTSTTTIQDAAEDIRVVDQAISLGAITGWTMNPNWTAETGGLLATKTVSGSAPWPTDTPPQADAGTMSATQTWTVYTPACNSAAVSSATPTRSAASARSAAVRLTPASSAAASSAAASSSCGLAITSPPDNSIIAITDPNFIDGAMIGPDQRAPALDALKLYVSGTSTCQGPVTVNGVPATADGDSWNAEIPVTALGLGADTLTAKAAACTDATSTVTLINLNITSPAEDDSLAITPQPAMPELNATVSVDGYPSDTSNVSFDWELSLRGEYIDRGGWHSYPFPGTPVTGSTTGTQTPWNLPDDTPIVGGVGRLSVSADLPGVLDDPVQSGPRWISIPGTNPDPGAVNSDVATLDPADATTIEHIFCYESGGQGVSYPQFNSGANQGEPAFAVIPVGWTPNPPVLQPNFGAAPAGIGIAQLDPASFPAQQWDWTQNVSGGVREYQGDLAAARKLQGKEQTRLKNELEQVLTLVNATRAAKGMDPVTVPLQVVPAEPAPYDGIDGVTADAITRYNTGTKWRLFYFNYHYVASADNLQVLTIGTAQWVEQDGRWKGGNVHTAATWTVNPSWNPDYPNRVEGCSPPQ